MSPIMCGRFMTKEKVEDKWLGNMFHQDGLAASVMATITSREAKVKGACYEAAAIVEDWKAQVGGFMSALDLFEIAILQTLLYNAETWVEISKEAEDRLEMLQLFFLRLVLRVPKSTPKIPMKTETGMMSMRLRIWKKKLMFVHHIKNLEKETLARQVWNNWPSLAKEVKKICEQLDIEEASSDQ